MPAANWRFGASERNALLRELYREKVYLENVGGTCSGKVLSEKFRRDKNVSSFFERLTPKIEKYCLILC